MNCDIVKVQQKHTCNHQTTLTLRPPLCKLFLYSCLLQRCLNLLCLSQDCSCCCGQSPYHGGMVNTSQYYYTHIACMLHDHSAYNIEKLGGAWGRGQLSLVCMHVQVYIIDVPILLLVVGLYNLEKLEIGGLRVRSCHYFGPSSPIIITLLYDQPNPSDDWQFFIARQRLTNTHPYQ